MPGKVLVKVKIVTEVEIPYSAYLGTEATLDEHIKRAVEEVKSWQVFVSKNGINQSTKSTTVSFDSLTIKED